MSSRVFVLGSLNMDLVIRADKMPQAGETVGGGWFMTNPGGKGANQAVAASKLGADVYMIGAVGKEFGSELRKALCGYGVHDDFVAKREDVSSGVAVIVLSEGDNRIILDAGANGTVCPEQIDVALAFARPGDWLVAQLEVPVEAVAYALKRARQIGMITLLNPAPARELPEGTLSLCDWFVPNQSETAFYTGKQPENEAEADACATALQASGAGNVLITLGTAGSFCKTSDGAVHKAGCRRVEAVDTTAAGDTFVGAFVTRLTEGASVDEAMAFAASASAVTVTRPGAQQAIPYRNEIRE